MRPYPIAAALVTLLALAACPGAGAATVRLEDQTRGGNKGPDFTVQVLKLEDTAAERNEVTVSLDGHTITVRDAASPLTAGTHCTQVGPSEVTCVAPDPLDSSAIDLGDGDDSFSATGALPQLRLTGGNGNDRIEASGSVDGGPGDDVITGGAGSDFLNAGPGSDRVSGGAGDDTITGDDPKAPPSADVLDGGPGKDHVSYAGRTDDIRIDLSDPGAPAGAAGEGDTLSGFEEYATGLGSDTLIGTDAPDNFDAGPGNNTVTGGGGLDTIFGDGTLDGGDGDDLVGCNQQVNPLPPFTPGPLGSCTATGGAGDDRLVGSLGPDTLDGGPGNDELSGYEGSDRLLGGAGDDQLLGEVDVRVMATDIEHTIGPGDDSLDGGAGNDFLFGGLGNDSYSGGDGDDRIEAFDGSGETVDCGAGTDSARQNRSDRVAACETSVRGFKPEFPKRGLYIDAGQAYFEIACPEYAITGCRVTLRLRTAAGRLLSKRTRKLGASGGEEAYLSLKARDRRLWRKHKRMRVKVFVTLAAGDSTATRSRTYRPRFRA